MINDADFSWVDFYKELASKLIKFKDDRKALIDIVVKVYDDIGIKLPTLEKENKIIDIDPFTFFGLFNKSSLKKENRVKIIMAIAKELEIEAPIPTGFESIPTLNNQNATFYYFVGERGEDDINHLWALFESALEYAKKQTNENRATVSKCFDLVINKKGNGNSKTTMGLYWIAPDFYLNFDSRNKWYIYDSGRVPDEIVSTLPDAEGKINAQTYFDIVEIIAKYIYSGKAAEKNFCEFSHEAWRYSSQVNQERKKEAEKKETKQESEEKMTHDEKKTQYWLYSPGENACMWERFFDLGIMALGWSKIGDLSLFETKEDMKKRLKEMYGDQYTYKNAAHATWQFAKEMKPGDIVFVKKGMHKIIGRGVVKGEYKYQPNETKYYNIREVEWTHVGEWEHPGQAVTKVLTKITEYVDYVEKLNAIFTEKEEKNQDKYTREDFLNDVYLSEGEYDSLVNLLKNKMNVILQGAPGVGKTFAANKLA